MLPAVYISPPEIAVELYPSPSPEIVNSRAGPFSSHAFRRPVSNEMLVLSDPWKQGHSPAFWDAIFEKGIIINKKNINDE
jgi:hypothetical protein